MKKIILILLFILIFSSFINNNIIKSISLSDHIQGKNLMLRPPWNYNYYFLYPSTYDGHNNGKYGAIDFYYDSKNNKACNITYERKGDSGIDVLAANDGEVIISFNKVNTVYYPDDLECWEMIEFNTNSEPNKLPKRSFKFKKNGITYYYDMEIIIKNDVKQLLRTFYVHLDIDEIFFKNKEESIKKIIKERLYQELKDYEEFKTNIYVSAGERLGKINKRGNAASPHLHFQVKRESVYLDLRDVEFDFGNHKEKIIKEETPKNNYYFYPSMPCNTSFSCTDSFETNDTMESAYGTLNPYTPYKAKICSPNDKDYFKINVASQGTINLNLIVPSNRDYDLYLYKSNGNEIKRSANGTGKNESINISISSGIHYILVVGYKGSYDTEAEYILSGSWPITTTPPPSTGTMSVSPTTWSPNIKDSVSTYNTFTISAINGNISGVKVEKINGPNWLSISKTDLGDISSGSSKTFNLILSPPLGTSGSYQYTVRLKCSSGSPSSIDITGTISVISQAQYGSMAGYVYNSSNNTKIQGAKVSLINTSLYAYTDSNGNYTINNIPAGTYTVKVEAQGYETKTESVTINSNQTLPKSFYLKPITTDITLKLYVHEDSSNGPLLSGVRIFGNDGGGNSFDRTTDNSGFVTISGKPGNWSFTASKTGYETKRWTKEITSSCERHEFISKALTPSFEVLVDRGCGQTYKIGDTITVVGKSNVTATGTLYSYWSDGSVKTYSVQFKSNQMVTLLTSPISGATGKRVYKAKVTYNGVTYDSNECSINVVSDIQETGTIDVFANLNGSSWTGSLNFTLSGSTSLSGNTVPSIFYNVPVGTYTITYISGGPPNATLQSITPSKTQTLSKGEIKIFTLNFVTQAQYGSMAGYVYNSSNNTKIQGAKVSLINTSLYAYTDSNGNYTINNIPAGTYTVKVEAQGYETKTESVTINSNQTLPKSFYLTPRSSATKPSPPRNLRVTSVGDSVVNLAWDPPSSDGGSQIISYKIYRGTCSGCEKEYKTIPSSYTTFQNIGSSYVVNGTTYYYYVTAINSVGESSPSNEVYATPRSSATKPSPPRNLNIIGVFSKETWKAGVYLTWEPPSSDGGSSITEYRMYRRNEGGSYYSIGRREAQYTHFRYWDNISLGGSYYFKITAVNSVGESDPSNEKYIYVTVTAKTESNVRVRTAPGLSSQEIITLPPGVYGVASRGPIYSDNYHWLYIKWNYNGKYYEGWSAGELCWFQTSPSNLTNSINSSKNLLYNINTLLKTDEIKTIIGKLSKTLNLTEKLTIIIDNPCSFKFEICNLLCTNIYYYSFENFHKYYPRGAII